MQHDNCENAIFVLTEKDSCGNIQAMSRINATIFKKESILEKGSYRGKEG